MSPAGQEDGTFSPSEEKTEGGTTRGKEKIKKNKSTTWMKFVLAPLVPNPRLEG